MADPTPEEAAPPPSKGKPAMIIVGALLAGLAVGGKVVAPRLSATPKSAAAAEHGEGEKKEPPKIFRLDNVIVNPAGSAGQRYLIVSVAFEVPDAETQERLTRAEVQLRDIVTGLVERQTLADLTQLGARDSLRQLIITAVKPFVDGKAVKVYVPQFLIQ